MKNWKTTASGICTIAMAIVSVVQDIINGTTTNWAVVMTGVMTGIGLISAKDSNVTGGTVKQ